MVLKTGIRLVHPAHGASEVIAIENREIAGRRERFIILKPLLYDMMVYIPEANADKAGLRMPVEREEFLKVLDNFHNGEPRALGEGENWQQRFRAYSRMIQSGDLYKIGIVIQFLCCKSQKKGLSATEDFLLDRAFNLFISEYLLIDNLPREEARAFIYQAFNFR